MTSLSKNVCIDELDDITNKYNNTYHRAIKIKPVDVTSSISIDVNKENNKESPKVKIGHNVIIIGHNIRIQKHFFGNIVLFPNLSEKSFVIKKVKSTMPWTYVISDLNREEIVETFCEKELKKKKKKKK